MTHYVTMLGESCLAREAAVRYSSARCCNGGAWQLGQRGNLPLRLRESQIGDDPVQHLDRVFPQQSVTG